MKCKECNGCTRLVRVNKENSVAKLFWVCMLCKKVYLFGTLKTDDPDSNLALDAYRKLYGDQV